MKSFLIVIAGICLSIGAHAADKEAGKPGPGKTSELTKEQREAMAKAHEKMSACLRSDKAISICHDEMMSSCKANNACPMHAMHGHMGKQGMMQDSQ